MQYITPCGEVYNFFEKILNNNHVLICGSTGSGKSVLVNGLIYTALYHAPPEKQLILIDLKKVELYSYRGLPHNLLYADNIQDTENALYTAVEIMHTRYNITRAAGLKTYNGSDIYIVIDEYADIKFNGNKNIDKYISLLLTQGRAAKIHLIICTQRPTRDILNPLIKANTEMKIALRTDSQQESKNIINVNYAYSLPRFGKCIYKEPGEKDLILQDIPLISDNEINRIINFWLSQTTPQPAPPPVPLFKRIKAYFRI